MKFKRRLNNETELDNTPMIDVVFLLVIFLAVSSIYVVATSIQINLPESQSADAQPSKDIVISIMEDGSMFINDEAVTMTSLAQKLTYAMNAENERFIVIRSDGAAKTQELIDVMDVCRLVGADGVHIAVEKLEQQSIY